jgi:hypothetical protein
MSNSRHHQLALSIFALITALLAGSAGIEYGAEFAAAKDNAERVEIITESRMPDFLKMASLRLVVIASDEHSDEALGSICQSYDFNC